MEDKPKRRKPKKQKNSDLLEVAKEARKAGMSYGKYVQQKYLEEQMKEKEKIKLTKQAEHIQKACLDCGLGGRVTWFDDSIKPTAPAYKIMREIKNRHDFPAKLSFMHCDELDMCFFYGPDGTARCSYSGTAKAGSDDIRHNIIMAFKTAEQVLDKMQELAIKDRY